MNLAIFKKIYGAIKNFSLNLHHMFYKKPHNTNKLFIIVNPFRNNNRFRNLRLLGFLTLYIIHSLSYGSTSSDKADNVFHSVDSLKNILVSKPNDVESIRKLGLLALNMANDKLALECGTRLMDISNRDNRDKKAATYANLILGQVAILKSDPKKAYRMLTEARKLAEINADSASLTSIFNGLAIYALSYVGDIPEAIQYYHKGLAAANASGNKRLYYTILNNIANAHLEIGDTLGLKYARQCYENSKATNNHWLKYTSALCLADTYLSLKDYTRSMRYISEAESALPHLQDYSPSILYDMRARVQAAIGGYEEAAKNFRKAKDLSFHTPERYLNFLNNEAECNISKGELHSANILIDSVLLISSDTTNTYARIKALRLKSTVNEKLGNLAEALKYQKAFNELKSSTVNANTARMMSEAHIKWELDDLLNQLAQQRIMTIRHQRNFHIALIGILALIIIIATLFHFNDKLKKLHIGIVTQMKMALKREESLKNQIETLKSRNRETSPKAAPISSNVKSSQSILDDIENLFAKEKTYTDPHITRDSLAEAIGTNPSYVTRAIAECCKTNFKQFVNNYRIHEAIRILSDPDDDTPLKNIGSSIGFNSTTSFYNHFKEATGMTPAAYREASQKRI